MMRRLAARDSTAVETGRRAAVAQRLPRMTASPDPGAPARGVDGVAAVPRSGAVGAGTGAAVDGARPAGGGPPGLGGAGIAAFGTGPLGTGPLGTGPLGTGPLGTGPLSTELPALDPAAGDPDPPETVLGPGARGAETLAGATLGALGPATPRAGSACSGRASGEPSGGSPLGGNPSGHSALGTDVADGAVAAAMAANPPLPRRPTTSFGAPPAGALAEVVQRRPLGTPGRITFGVTS
jgi:hypothetical protein